jgi:serine/threonine protein phosphatase PrpC
VSRTCIDDLRWLVFTHLTVHPGSCNNAGGEDAFFIQDLDMGVFDGVGGWRSLGYDPARYSREFAANAAANITAQRAAWQAQQSKPSSTSSSSGAAPESASAAVAAAVLATFKGVDLKLALTHALEATQCVGSCTACMVSFDPQSGLLTGLNLGDSGMLLLRRDLSRKLFVAYR